MEPIFFRNQPNVIFVGLIGEFAREDKELELLGWGKNVALEHKCQQVS